MDIEGFKKLIIWKRSMVLSKDIYELSKKLPEDEKFGLISQMRRCAVSVPSNIAEGYGRYNDKELTHFLRIARGSLYELVTQINLCNMLGFIEEASLVAVSDKAKEIDKMIISFINKMEGYFK